MLSSLGVKCFRMRHKFVVEINCVDIGSRQRVQCIWGVYIYELLF